jgi:hypothetical protein
MTTTHNKFTDQELIALINRNDEVAIATFLNRYKNKFYNNLFKWFSILFKFVKIVEAISVLLHFVCFVKNIFIAQNIVKILIW